MVSRLDSLVSLSVCVRNFVTFQFRGWVWEGSWFQFQFNSLNSVFQSPDQIPSLKDCDHFALDRRG